MNQGAGRPEFPRRGMEMTRLETFTDAAFAFAATLLAISIDAVPGTFDELMEALKGAPAFAASLAILLLYWRAHQTWSDRFGLQDLPSVLLTFGLIMVVMIYVYPLKIMFGAAFHFVTGGWIPSTFELNSYHEFRVLLTVYGTGFFLLNAVISGLYWHARRKRAVLGMSDAEVRDCAGESIAWLVVGAFGPLSILLAWTLPDEQVPVAAWFYSLLAIVGPGIGFVIGRVEARRAGHTGA